MENEALSILFRRIADLLDYQGVAFKPAAYRRAAQTIEDLTTDIADITDKSALMELPGIGEATASKIIEYCTTGKVVFLEKLEAETQMGAAALLAVDDLGPKRVREIEQSLHIRTIAELIEACEKGKLRLLPRFSELLEKKILESAKRAGERTKRFVRSDIEADVRSLLTALRTVRGVAQADAAGSFRREKETVGDIDILIGVVVPSEELATEIADAIRMLPIVERVIAAGETRIAFDLRSGLRVDIRIIALALFGSALLYFTGSKEHNIVLRRRAIEQGMKLSEYGLFKNEKVVAAETEEEIYAALGLPFMEPQDRTGNLPLISR